MDQFTRRLIGVGVQCGAVTDADACRMSTAANHRQRDTRRAVRQLKEHADDTRLGSLILVNARLRQKPSRTQSCPKNMYPWEAELGHGPETHRPTCSNEYFGGKHVHLAHHFAVMLLLATAV